MQASMILTPQIAECIEQDHRASRETPDGSRADLAVVMGHSHLRPTSAHIRKEPSRGELAPAASELARQLNWSSSLATQRHGIAELEQTY